MSQVVFRFVEVLCFPRKTYGANQHKRPVCRDATQRRTVASAGMLSTVGDLDYRPRKKARAGRSTHGTHGLAHKRRVDQELQLCFSAVRAISTPGQRTVHARGSSGCTFGKGILGLCGLMVSNSAPRSISLDRCTKGTERSRR